MRPAFLFFVVIALFILMGSALGQNVEYVASTLWTGVIDVKIVGNYAYCAFVDGLVVLNISSPASPSLVGQLYLHGSGIGIDVSGNYAYLADGDSGFQIIDVSNPANPTLAGSYDTPSDAYDVFVLGNYAYVADDYSGLQIIDVSNPANPTLAGSYETHYAWGVFVLGNYAYVADGYTGLQIINVSNPANPTLAGSYDTPGTASDAYVSGEFAYVADGSSLQILRFTPTGVEENHILPSHLSLSQNFPNPFNARTTIQYSLPEKSMVSIGIFDILGRKIETLAEGMKLAGEHQATWDASGQSSGIYFYRIKAGDKIETKKMVLVK